MRDFKGITIYTDEDLRATGVDIAGDFVQLRGAPLHISSRTEKAKIFDLYLKNYDMAVPQKWEDEYERKNGKPSGAVWCYDKNRVLGEPVFWADIFGKFSQDAIADACERSFGTSLSQQAGYGYNNEHPDYPVDDWRYEVSNGDTKLSYEEWLDHRIEEIEHEQSNGPEQ